MRAVRWFIRITATIVALAFLFIAGAGLLVGTEAGTRWLLGVGSEYAPGELTFTEPEGSLLRGVRFGSLAWQDESTAVSADKLLVAIELLPLVRRRLNVERLAAGRLDIRIADSDEEPASDSGPYVDLPIAIVLEDAALDAITLELGDSSYELADVAFAVSLEGPRLGIDRLAATAYGIRIDTAGTVRLTPELPARLRANWRQLAGNAPGLAGSLTLAGSMDGYDLEHALTEPVVVSTEGRISLGADGPTLAIENRWNAIEYSYEETSIRTPGGALGIRGTLASLDVELDTTVGVDTYPDTAIDLAAVIADLDSATIETLTLDNAWLRADITGSALFTPVPSLDLEIAASRVDPAAFRDDFDGELAVQGSAAITFPETGVEVSAAVDGIIGLLNGLDVVGSTGFEYAPGHIEIAGANLRIGRNSLRGTATLAETVSVDAEATLAAIEELLPSAAGSADIRVLLGGTRDMPEGTVQFTGEELRYADTSIDTATIVLQGSPAEHTIDANVGAFDSTLELVAGGGLEDEAWRGEIGSLSLSNAALGAWSSQERASVSLTREALQLSELCLDDAATSARACVDVTRTGEAVTEFDASIAGLPIAALPLPIPAGVTVAGTIEALARGSMAEGRLTADADVNASGAGLAAEYEGETASVRFDTARSKIAIVDNGLDAGLTILLGDDAGNIEATLGAADVLDPASAVRGQASLALEDAGLFAVFVPSITNPRGRIAGELRAAGTVGEPEITGSISLVDGAFSVRPAGIDVRDVNLRAEQLQPGVLSIAGSALSGEGRVSIEGGTSLVGDTGLRSEIRIVGENFELLRLPDWQLAASPDVDIVFDEQAAVVTGSLAIPVANIRVKTLPEAAVRPAADAIVHQPGSTELPSGRHVSIDVETELGDDVSFDGFGLTTGLSGAVRIQGGTQQAYSGFGQVDLVGGRYEAYGQDLTIERGQLVFSGPLSTPALDVRATREIDNIVAGIHVTGTAGALRSDVFSEPPLSDAETLSYLLTGRPLSGATTQAEGDVLNKAAFALGMSRAGAIASQLGGALGLETLSVEGGSADGRIVAGKRIGGRLLVEYGYGLVDNLGTLLLRYQVNRRLILESRTGTVSNLDIVYSVKKK